MHGEWVRARPMVLGHEGAGVVTAIGGAVDRVRVGDHVVLSWAAPCGSCDACLRGAGQRRLQAREAIGKGTLIDGTTRIRLRGALAHARFSEEDANPLALRWGK